MKKLDLYSPLSDRTRGDYPVSPFVHFAIEHNGEHILVSEQLMTDREIDDRVRLLTDELNELAQEAKRELKSLQEKMLKR